MSASTPCLRCAVLVVEDEPLLRMDAMDLAEEAGFRAYGAAFADEAIALLKQHDDIQILFTDIQMKGSMDGLKLAHAVRRRWPPVAIIVTSGAARVAVEQLPERGVFLSKPYAPRDVMRTMRELAVTNAA